MYVPVVSVSSSGAAFGMYSLFCVRHMLMECVRNFVNMYQYNKGSYFLHAFVHEAY